MKAKELRIGNYILLEKKHVIKCDLIDIELSLIDREPIPLTEEILLKCGFEKNNIHKDPRMYEYCIDYMPYIRTIDNSKTFEISFYTTRIEYLHQLQNLYFALTGKEKALKILKELKELDMRARSIHGIHTKLDRTILRFLSEIGHEDIVKEYREVIKKTLEI